jgi:rare lipoprotein A
MIWRLAALLGFALCGAFGAAAEDLSAFSDHPAARQGAGVVGLASWYGSDFHGHKTADGEIFNMHALSAAHRTMSLPSYARVTNLANGRSIIVRVNDRGPYIGGRMLDVSARVAELLAFNHVGLAKVRLDYVGKAPPAGSDEPKLLASLRVGEAPAFAALAPPVAAALVRPAPLPASEEGVTVITRSIKPMATVNAYSPLAARTASNDNAIAIARAVDPQPDAEPRSPFGILIAYPFSGQASQP